MTDTSTTMAARRIEEEPLARRSTILHDLATIARRACRSVFREPEFFIPALITPVFFFVVNIGARAKPEPVDLDGLLGIELPFDDLDIPATPADLARALRDSYADARDSRMSKIHVATDIVFVSISALEMLWARAKESDKTSGGPKADASRRKTKNSRRRK